MAKEIATGKLTSLQTKHNAALVELENYKLLVESVSDYAIFLLDPKGYIMSWNKGAQRAKGYTESEIVGQHFSKFYLERDKKARKPERELEIAERVGRIEDEDWRVRKDGSRFWANVIITALFGPDKNLVGFAKVTRDLTERKKQEDNLREANDTLRKQRANLEILNNSKDEFISLASHQLRTPATAIKQLLGLLLEGFQGELTPEQQLTIQKAYESNERQLSIVNSLLQVAQLDAGKVVLRRQTSDVCKLIKDVVEEQSDTIKDRRQKLSLSLPKTALPACIDTKYFRMALENLLDNASKYTPQEGKISIAAKTVGDQIRISISDTGVGIAPEDHDKLFEKFMRLPNDLSQKVSGSGLGLYWVREVVSLHEGSIKVESVPGKGTTFTIVLPEEAADA